MGDERDGKEKGEMETRVLEGRGRKEGEGRRGKEGRGKEGEGRSKGD